MMDLWGGRYAFVKPKSCGTPACLYMANQPLVAGLPRLVFPALASCIQQK